MSELWKVLAQLVGNSRTAEEQKNFKYRRSINALPPGATNVEMAPLMYLDTRVPPTFVPDKEWTSRQEANYSTLGGIRLPETYNSRLTLPGILAHETFHANDPDRREAKDKSKNKAETEHLNQLASALEAYRASRVRQWQYVDPSITGQPGANELMAQSVGWEALQPAGNTFLRSQLAKDLGMTPEQRLAYHRRRYPIPDGLDAVVGVPER